MTAFDPYHKWLGIPPAEQPPNHYRLLGVGQFEQDADVIESAADRQMVHVQSQKHGPHADQSQRLLNELAAARVALLDPHKKAAYDAELRARSAPRHVARAVSAAPPPPMPSPLSATPPPPLHTPASHAAASPADDEQGVILEQPGVEVREPSPVSRYAGRRKKSRLPLILASLGGGAAVLAVIIVLASNNSDRGDDQTRKQPSTPGGSTAEKSTSPTGGPGRPLPNTPALWKADQDKPPRENPEPKPPNGNPGGTNPGGNKPGPVRLPDPIILGPDGKPKHGGTAGETSDNEDGDDVPAADPPTPPRHPSPPTARFPVPGGDELQTARRELRENYADDFKSLKSDEKKFNLAEKLFKAAPLEKKGSPRRYAMWETIRDLSQDAGVPKGAANAAAALVEEFDIPDPVQVVANSFYEASRNARTPEGRDAAAEYVSFLVQVALTHDHFAGARRVVQAGKAVAASSPAAKRGPLNEEFDSISRGLNMFEAQHRLCVAASDTLEDAPTDAAAHEAVGVYQGLFKDDWSVAVAHLKFAENDELKKQGQGEAAALATPPAPRKMTDMAAGWTAYALRQNSPLKEAALLRARHWYETALFKLRADDKKRAKQAIEDIDAQLESLEFATFLEKLRTAQELAKGVGTSNRGK